MASLSQLLDVKVLEQPNGDLLITTHRRPDAADPCGASPFGVAMRDASAVRVAVRRRSCLAASMSPAQLQGGQIGANITLRDTTLPTDQAELDEFAQNLASRFDAQGLTLFTDPTGAVPASVPPPPVQTGYVGFAATIQVNPLVQAHAVAGARRHAA